jgi:hypothetical protein
MAENNVVKFQMLPLQQPIESVVNSLNVSAIATTTTTTTFFLTADG